MCDCLQASRSIELWLTILADASAEHESTVPDEGDPLVEGDGGDTVRIRWRSWTV